MLTPLLFVLLAVVLLGWGLHALAQRKALDREKRRNTQFLNSITDAYIRLDRDWRFLQIGPRAADIYGKMGKEPAAMLGRSYWEEFPESKGTLEEKEFRRAVEHHTNVSFESFHTSPRRWFEMNAFATAEGLSVFFSDITDRKVASEDTARALRELNDVKAALDQHAI